MMQTKELEAYLEASNYTGRYSNTTHDCSCSGNAAAPVRTVTPVRSNVVTSNNATNPIIPRGATAENTATPSSPSRVNAPVQTTAVRVDNGGSTPPRSNTTTAPRVNAPVQTPAVRVDNGGTTPPRSNINPNPIVVVTPGNQTPNNPTTPGNGTNNPSNPSTPGNGTNNPTNPSTPGNGTNNPTNPSTPGNGTNNPTDPYQPPSNPTDFPGAATGMDPISSTGSGNSGMPIEPDETQQPVDQNGNPIPVAATTSKAGNWLLALLAAGTIYMMVKKNKATEPRTVKI